MALRCARIRSGPLMSQSWQSPLKRTHMTCRGEGEEDSAMTDYQHIIVDNPRPNVSRITLNRPDSRNALNNVLRGELYSTLESNDRNPDVRVTIIRGAGKAFAQAMTSKLTIAKIAISHIPGDGNWARHVVDGFFRVGFSETRYRPSSRLLPGRRYRTCDVLRSRLLRRRCNDRISGGSFYEPARQSVFPSLAGASKRYGNDVNGRCH